MEFLLNDENGRASYPDPQWLNKKENIQFNYATLSKITYTEDTPKKSTTKNKQTKRRICELLNAVGMSHLGEDQNSHTLQEEVRNQL